MLWLTKSNCDNVESKHWSTRSGKHQKEKVLCAGPELSDPDGTNPQSGGTVHLLRRVLQALQGAAAGPRPTGDRRLDLLQFGHHSSTEFQFHGSMFRFFDFTCPPTSPNRARGPDQRRHAPLTEACI